MKQHLICNSLVIVLMRDIEYGVLTPKTQPGSFSCCNSLIEAYNLISKHVIADTTIIPH